MKVAALKGGVRHVDIIFKEEDGFEPGQMWIDYKPGELTIDVVESVQSGIRDNSEAGAILDMLSLILVDWDLEMDVVDEDGNPTGEVQKVPATTEGLRLVPLPALGFIFASMMNDVRPKDPKDDSSESSSPQEELPEKSLSGTS